MAKPMEFPKVVACRLSPGDAEQLARLVAQRGCDTSTLLRALIRQATCRQAKGATTKGK